METGFWNVSEVLRIILIQDDRSIYKSEKTVRDLISMKHN